LFRLGLVAFPSHESWAAPGFAGSGDTILISRSVNTVVHRRRGVPARHDPARLSGHDRVHQEPAPSAGQGRAEGRVAEEILSANVVRTTALGA
jgi:hypothetical protein